jgi:hypothetical protein
VSINSTLFETQALPSMPAPPDSDSDDEDDDDDDDDSVEADCDKEASFFSGQPGLLTISGASDHDAVNTSFEITRELVNGKPIWHAVGGFDDIALFMGRSGYWIVSTKAQAKLGEIRGWLVHTKQRAVSPKDLQGSIFWQENRVGKNLNLTLTVENSMDHNSKAFSIEYAFSQYDKDSSGFLEQAELVDLLFDCGVEADVEDWIAGLDTNEDGRFTFQEFEQLYNKLMKDKSTV